VASPKGDAGGASRTRPFVVRGTTMKREKIWLSSPTIHGEEQQFVQEAFDTNWVAPLGKNVDAFEQELAAYLGAGYGAALSSGTPVLVLGWHYKYQELLSLYSQNRWLINQDECDSAKLLAMFNEFWRLREKNQQTILSQYNDVRRKIISEGKKMYGETK